MVFCFDPFPIKWFVVVVVVVDDAVAYCSNGKLGQPAQTARMGRANQSTRAVGIFRTFSVLFKFQIVEEEPVAGSAPIRR